LSASQRFLMGSGERGESLVTFVVVYGVNSLRKWIEAVYDSQEDFLKAGDPGPYRAWHAVTVVDRAAQQEWIAAEMRSLDAYPGLVRDANRGVRESPYASIVQDAARLMKELEAVAKKKGNQHELDD
jgi:hypothetical protein